MSDSLNLFQKLAKIRKQVEVVQKNKSGYGYKYVTDDELLAKITAFMDKYGVSLIPSVNSGTMKVEPYTYKKTKKEKTKDGFTVYEENVNEIMVYGDMKYIWVDNENPDDRIVVDWALVGHQSDGFQSFGSALTHSMRYFLLKSFNISTPEDDPDNWRSKQRAAEAAEEVELANQIIKEFDAMVRGYLSSNEDKKDGVKKLVSKYVKSGDYMKIKDSTLATKLLTDFKETFMKEEK